MNFRFLFRRENAKFGDGIYPEDARTVGLTDGKPFQPTERYRFALRHTARSGESSKPWMERNPRDLRWVSAIASIWYDEIEWERIRESLADDPKMWRADIKVRFKARRVVAVRGP